MVACPSLGARTKQVQTNSLLDNDKGMAVSRRSAGRHGHAIDIALIGDHNFSTTQITRVLRLELLVQGRRR